MERELENYLLHKQKFPRHGIERKLIEAGYKHELYFSVSRVQCLGFFHKDFGRVCIAVNHYTKDGKPMFRSTSDGRIVSKFQSFKAVYGWADKNLLR